MINTEKADRAPYSEWWIDYLWNKVELGLYGCLLDEVIEQGGSISHFVKGTVSERLEKARSKGIITLEEARWMYLVSVGLAVNRDVYDSIERQ